MNLVNPYRFASAVSTSYANTGGTGDRRAGITISQSSAGFPIASAPNLPLLLDGVTGGSPTWFSNSCPDNEWVKFNFGSGKIINEFKLYQSSATAQGTWKVQGSNDDTSWSDVGSSFTLGGGADPAVITAISANTTSYQYYRLIKVSGSTTAAPYVREFEFKISA